MGFYIEHNTQGEPLSAKGKADELLASPGVTEIHGKIEWQPNLVCVVENGFFDAAGFCFNEAEFLAFKHPDGRPRRWLVVQHAAELAGLDPATLGDPHSMQWVGRSFPLKESARGR